MTDVAKLLAVAPSLAVAVTVVGGVLVLLRAIRAFGANGAVREMAVKVNEIHSDVRELKRQGTRRERRLARLERKAAASEAVAADRSGRHEVVPWSNGEDEE